ncbi:hypothetical protein FRB94_002910 [Tulasnella sp. JGI-2019a]|nr:hypothetical protein FRB93_013930 [Tulasnella sp. JGI-2019a]KAG9013382.1 hypothetical protein FRB94_002910 [Tulasnella sp. JGI-2019a]KAG9033728.1 hypothetical protein FRB95_014415 [Tulasnella sp. JGI-2019a]
MISSSSIRKLITRGRSEELEAARREEWLQNMKEHLESIVDGDDEDYAFLDRRGYIFDLDCGEHLGTEDPKDGDHDGDIDMVPNQDRPRYSIDAWAAGNWTRFLNHACDPNVKVYTAITEPYHHENPPPGSLVFVTTRRIRKREELRIDYNPGLKALGKGKRQRQDGSMNLKLLSMNSLIRAGSSTSTLRSDSASVLGGSRTMDSDEEMTIIGSERGEKGRKGKKVDLKADQVRCECDSGNCRVWIKV